MIAKNLSNLILLFNIFCLTTNVFAQQNAGVPQPLPIQPIAPGTGPQPSTILPPISSTIQPQLPTTLAPQVPITPLPTLSTTQSPILVPTQPISTQPPSTISPAGQPVTLAPGQTPSAIPGAPAENASCRFQLIKPGDTFNGLSKENNVSLTDILRANPNLNPLNLVVGTPVCIPKI